MRYWVLLLFSAALVFGCGDGDDGDAGAGDAGDATPEECVSIAARNASMSGLDVDRECYQADCEADLERVMECMSLHISAYGPGDFQTVLCCFSCYDDC